MRKDARGRGGPELGAPSATIAILVLGGWASLTICYGIIGGVPRFTRLLRFPSLHPRRQRLFYFVVLAPCFLSLPLLSRQKVSLVETRDGHVDAITMTDDPLLIS